MTIFQIDKIAYNSKIYNVNPAVKMAAGFIPLIICIAFSRNAVSIAVITVMGVQAVYCSQISIYNYLKLMTVPFIFIAAGVITVAFTQITDNSGITIFTFFGKEMGFTYQSVNKGIVLMLKSLGAVSCTYFISLNTTMPDMAYVLKKCRTPAIIISLIELIYRYIFLLLEEGNRIKTAQTSRLGYYGFKSAVRSAGELAGSLLIRSLYKADRVYTAMVSRGYTNALPVLRRQYGKSTKTAASAALISTGLLLTGFLL